MYPTTTTVYIPIRLSQESAEALQQEAEKFGLSSEELASTILDSACPFDIMTDDESGHAYLTQMKELYPHRWPQLKADYLAYEKALASARDRDQSEVNSLLDQTITLTLPPAMVIFMRETGDILPGLWDRFAAECVEAVSDNLQNYAVSNYSFKTTEDRRDAFRLIGRANKKYLQAIGAEHKVGQ